MSRDEEEVFPQWLEKKVAKKLDTANEIIKAFNVTMSEAIGLMLLADVNSISYRLYVLEGDEDGKKKEEVHKGYRGRGTGR